MLWKKKEKQPFYLKTGKFLIDIAKLVFGGIILAGIMKFETVNTTLLYSLGGIAVTGCFIGGLVLIGLSKKG